MGPINNRYKMEKMRKMYGLLASEINVSLWGQLSSLFDRPQRPVKTRQGGNRGGGVAVAL
jgi:hypothetical protein